MKLGDGVEWAMHCAVTLAALPPGALLASADLAEYHGLMPSYLVKQLKALAQAGLLESVPGPRGGFRLGRPAQDISLLDIADALTGLKPFFRCTEIRACIPGAAPSTLPCEINSAMLMAEAAWRRELSAVSVAEIGQQVRARLTPEREEISRRWLQQRVRLA